MSPLGPAVVISQFLQAGEIIAELFLRLLDIGMFGPALFLGGLHRVAEHPAQLVVLDSGPVCFQSLTGNDLTLCRVVNDPVAWSPCIIIPGIRVVGVTPEGIPACTDLKGLPELVTVMGCW